MKSRGAVNETMIREVLIEVEVWIGIFWRIYACSWPYGFAMVARDWLSAGKEDSGYGAAFWPAEPILIQPCLLLCSFHYFEA